MAADGFDNRRLPCLRLVAREHKNVHARGAAALTQILPRGSEWRTNLSLEDDTSRKGSATLPEQCGHAASIALVSATPIGRQVREIAIFRNYL